MNRCDTALSTITPERANTGESKHRRGQTPERAALLELILKLNLMNRNQLTPNDNRAGELNQGKIIALLLLIAHQQFSEAVHMRMKHLDNPSACFKVRIFLFCFLFFSTGHNVRLIVVGGHDILLSRVTSVKAKILRTLLCHFRACNHNAVQSIRQ